MLPAMRFVVVACISLIACHAEDWLQYTWDDRRILCSQSVDDLTQDSEWGTARDQLRIARDNQTVALLHTHVPGVTVTIQGLEEFFQDVAAYDVDYVTYAELVPTEQHRAGVALAFDDNAIEQWYGIRDLLRSYGARVTFFVSRFASRTDQERAWLAELASDGHAIEAHGVNHINAEEFIPQFGVDQYLGEEALPSINVLQEAGYTPTAFAYPFGRDNPETNAVLLRHVERLRVGPRPCPY